LIAGLAVWRRRAAGIGVFRGAALEAKNLKVAPTVIERVLESYTSLAGAVFFCSILKDRPRFGRLKKEVS